MSTQVAAPGLPCWEGVGSPGIGGYVLADMAAVGALAVLAPLADATVQGLGDYVIGVLMVSVFGLIFSVPLALVGIPIVHFCCLRVRSQAVHVLAAGVVGFLVVAAPMALSSPDQGFLVEGLLLGMATAVGRAAVIPLARARMRVREQP